MKRVMVRFTELSSWEKMSQSAKDKYIAAHPESKYAKQAAAGKGKKAAAKPAKKEDKGVFKGSKGNEDFRFTPSKPKGEKKKPAEKQDIKFKGSKGNEDFKFKPAKKKAEASVTIAGSVFRFEELSSWERMSQDAKDRYIAAHPESKYAKLASGLKKKSGNVFKGSKGNENFQFVPSAGKKKPAAPKAAPAVKQPKAKSVQDGGEIQFKGSKGNEGFKFSPAKKKAAKASDLDQFVEISGSFFRFTELSTWEKMSQGAKDAYIASHPKSKYAKLAAGKKGKKADAKPAAKKQDINFKGSKGNEDFRFKAGAEKKAKPAAKKAPAKPAAKADKNVFKGAKGNENFQFKPTQKRATKK